MRFSLAWKVHTGPLDISNNTPRLIIHELDTDLGDATAGTYEIRSLVSQNNAAKKGPLEIETQRTSAAQHPRDFDQFDGYF